MWLGWLGIGIVIGLVVAGIALYAFARGMSDD